MKRLVVLLLFAVPAFGQLGTLQILSVANLPASCITGFSPSWILIGTGAFYTCRGGVPTQVAGGIVTAPGGSPTDVQFNQGGSFAGSGNLTTDGNGNTNQTGTAASAADVSQLFNSTPTLTVAQLTAADGCLALEQAIGGVGSFGKVDASAKVGVPITCNTNPFASVVQAGDTIPLDIGANQFQTTVQWVIPAKTYVTGPDGNAGSGTTTPGTQTMAGIVADPSFIGYVAGCSIAASGGTATWSCPSAHGLKVGNFVLFNGSGLDFDSSFKVLTVPDATHFTTAYAGSNTTYSPNTACIGASFTATRGTATVTCTGAHGLSTGATPYLSDTLIADLEAAALPAITVTSTTAFTFPYAGVAGTVASGMTVNVNAAALFIPLVWLGDQSGSSLASAGTRLRNLTVDCNDVATCQVNVFSDTINEDSGLNSVLLRHVMGTGFWVKDTYQSWGGGGVPANWSTENVTEYGGVGAPLNYGCMLIENGSDPFHDIGKNTCKLTTSTGTALAGIQIYGALGYLSSVHFENVNLGLTLQHFSGFVAHASGAYGSSDVGTAIVYMDSTDGQILVGQVENPHGSPVLPIQDGTHTPTSPNSYSTETLYTHLNISGYFTYGNIGGSTSGYYSFIASSFNGIPTWTTPNLTCPGNGVSNACSILAFTTSGGITMKVFPTTGGTAQIINLSSANYLATSPYTGVDSSGNWNVVGGAYKLNGNTFVPTWVTNYFGNSSDTNVLLASTVSGTVGAPLCSDGFGATTSGCLSGSITAYHLYSPYVSTTMTGTSGQNTVTVPATYINQISVGQVAAGTGIPAATFVTAVNTTTDVVTISANLTGSPSATAVTFSTINTGSTSFTQIASIPIPANTVTATGALRYTLGYDTCSGSTTPFPTCTTANTGTCTVEVALSSTQTGQTYQISPGTAMTAAKAGFQTILVQQQGSLTSEYTNESLSYGTTASSSRAGFGTINMGNAAYLNVFMTNSVSADDCGLTMVTVQTN